MKANKGKNGLFLHIFEASATFSSCRVRCGDPNMKITTAPQEREFVKLKGERPPGGMLAHV